MYLSNPNMTIQVKDSFSDLIKLHENVSSAHFSAVSFPELAPLVATFVLTRVQVQRNLHQLLLHYAEDLAAA